MEGRCESDCGRDEVYPATFGNEEETGLKLDDDDILVQLQRPKTIITQNVFIDHLKPKRQQTKSNADPLNMIKTVSSQ